MILKSYSINSQVSVYSWRWMVRPSPVFIVMNKLFKYSWIIHILVPVRRSYRRYPTVLPSTVDGTLPRTACASGFWNERYKWTTASKSYFDENSTAPTLMTRGSSTNSPWSDDVRVAPSISAPLHCLQRSSRLLLTFHMTHEANIEQLFSRSGYLTDPNNYHGSSRELSS